MLSLLMGKFCERSDNAIDAGKHGILADREVFEKVQIPMQEVEQILSKELSRLESQARIPTFTGVLAISRTREILRETQRRTYRR